MTVLVRKNFTSVAELVASLCNDLKNNGFALKNYNGSDGGSATIDDSIETCLLAPTTAVDILAVEDSDSSNANFDKRQPWRLFFKVHEDKGAFDVFACTPTNIKNDGGNLDVSVFFQDTTNNTQKSGMIGIDSFTTKTGSHPLVTGILPDTEWHSFRYEYWGIDHTKVDKEAVPLSYQLNISDHGMFFMMWAENMDNRGDHFFWFSIQRMVDDSGAVITDGFSPLFCVFSQHGGLNRTKPETPLASGIQRFVVRESDVHSPVAPTSAVIDQPDSARIINCIEQVSIYEDNKFVLDLPKELNSPRARYPHKLDMFGFTSADVISQNTEVDVTMFGEATPRKYKAMKANGPNNTGMRLLVLVKGGGVGS